MDALTALKSTEDRLIGSETPYGWAAVFERSGGSAKRYLLRFIRATASGSTLPERLCSGRTARLRRPRLPHMVVQEGFVGIDANDFFNSLFGTIRLLKAVKQT